jgi:type VI secretion system protein ImpM
MRCGLFGKHASRRDLVAVDVPGSVLAALEPWLQASLSASRERLGGAWQAAYLAAPIWRFWLGSDICGTTVLGALVASLDEIGRYYPLVVLAAGDSKGAIPPPEFDTNEAWFKAAEAFLLGTLEPGLGFDRVTAMLAALPPPRTYSPVVPRDPITLVRLGGVLCPLDDHIESKAFASLRLADWAAAYAGRSFWWTAGGISFRPVASAMRHLPHPDFFAAMLTGDFRAFTFS